MGDYVHVIREDPYNADLLFVGTSISAYVSIDAGATWSRLAANLPSVPVYDLKIHPRDRELIAATHGRGFWIVDIAPLEQLDSTVLADKAHLFEPIAAYQWGEGPTMMEPGNGNAQAFFSVPNPPYGADIDYWLGSGAGHDAVHVEVMNAAGDTVAALTGPGGPGVHSVSWNFQMRAAATPAPPAPLSPSERMDSILRAARAPQVIDSLRKAHYDSTALAQADALLNPPAAGRGGRGARGGGGGGGGGGRGGRGEANCDRPLTQWDPFCARPAEGNPAGRGGRGGGGFGRGAVPDDVQKIFDIIGMHVPTAGGRGGFGGGRGGFGSLAGTGDYLVTMSVGGQTYRQTLHVERVSGDDAAGAPDGTAGDGSSRLR